MRAVLSFRTRFLLLLAAALVLPNGAAAGEPLPRHLHIVVALVDNASQGIVPVPAALGNGDDPRSNLYWGAAYGVKTFLGKAPGWRKGSCERDVSAQIAERCVFFWKDRLQVTAEAYRGKAIDRAMLDFMQLAATPPPTNRREMVMFVGHNGLMDAVHARLPASFARHAPHARQAVVLACLSERYFAPHLAAAGAKSAVTTYSLMAPEGYVVEAVARAFADDAEPARMREAAGTAYASYQKIGLRAGKGVFGAR